MTDASTSTSTSRIVIRFLLDENVRNDVADVLRGRGHKVYLARDITAPGTPDHILATITAIDSLVFVTHDKDFLKALPEGHKTRTSKGSGRLQLLIPEATAKARLEMELEFIELHYERCMRLGGGLLRDSPENRHAMELLERGFVRGPHDLRGSPCHHPSC